MFQNVNFYWFILYQANFGHRKTFEVSVIGFFFIFLFLLISSKKGWEIEEK